MFRTHYSFENHDKSCHVNTLPSETIPGQAMSVPEIIKRSQRGLPVPGSREPLYTGEIEMPDFQRMDLADLWAFKQDNDAVIREYEKAVKEADEKLKQEKIQKATEEQLLKKLKDQQPNQTAPAGRPSGDLQHNSGQRSDDQ